MNLTEKILSLSVWQNADLHEYEHWKYHQELVRLDDNYPNLERIAAKYQPTSLLEIGSFVGCSLISLISGSENLTQVSVVDNEEYLENSNAICKNNVQEFMDRYIRRSVDVSFFKSCDELPTDCRFDMINVDGDHSYKGALLDLQFAFDLNPRVILIDDITLLPPVGRAVFTFCDRNSLLSEFIGTTHGMVVIDFEAQTR